MQTLKDLFTLELDDMYSSEIQMVKAYPRFIEVATSTELKDALVKHLKETEAHLQKLERIFLLFSVKPNESTCQAMEGLIREADSLIERYKISPPTLDAALISAAQKMEHYEIATYGTLRSFAKQLALEAEILEILTQVLEEEGAIDKKLTKLAEGSVFGGGINKEAASEKK